MIARGRGGDKGTVAYTAPFLVYIGLLAVQQAAGLPLRIFYPLHTLISAASIWLVSRRALSLRASRLWASVALGAAVLLIWIGPDALPGYRHHWLFENRLTGLAVSAIPPDLRSDRAFLAVCFVRSALVVPILEELFWRGWLMRWLIDMDFTAVKIGTYDGLAFWATALLFASEHGPYWEVGLIAGVIYNWWAVRTKNLADCMIAHTATNALLAAYVVAAGQWQFWL